MPNHLHPNPRKTIHKVRFDSEFCIVSNTVAQSETLSLQARGLLIYLLSLPETWEIRMDVLQAKTRLSVRPLRRIIRELAKAGHMHRFALPGDTPDTFSGSRWHVFAEPNHLAARLAETGRAKGFHRRLGLFAKVGKRPDVHKETVQATKNTQRPKPAPAELTAFLTQHGLSQRIATVYFANDEGYQPFPSNADGSTPPPRDWRAGLLSFAKASASPASTDTD